MQPMHRLYRATLLITVTLGLACAIPAHAGSFMLNQSNPSNNARAGAGDASASNNASATWFNAALLGTLKAPEFMIGGADYVLHGSFSKISATDIAGQPLTGGNGGDLGEHNIFGDGMAPGLFIALPIAPRTVLGFGLTTPFGLTTGYQGTSVLRYQAQYTSLAVNNLGASIGYRVNANFSVGFGVDLAQAQASLSNKVDSGAVCYASEGPAVCNSIGLYPQSHDGFVRVDGKDQALGWNAGVAWHHAGTTIGLAYRSRLFFNLTGSAEFNNFPALFTSQGLFVPTSTSAALNLPDQLDLSITQRLNRKWRISGSATYIRWGVLNGITVNFSNPRQPSTTTPFDYRNVWYLALGADYYLNPSWTLHGGIAYDESPVRTEYREPRLPDYNRRWVAVGATWHLSPGSSITLAYDHLFFNHHIPIDHTGSSGSTVIGTYAMSADIYSLGYRYTF